MIFLLVNTCFVNTVNASQTLICKWDDVASGLDSGTSGYFNFINVGTANLFETSTDYDLTAPNSLKCYGATDGCKGWLNLTQSYDYIGRVNFSIYDVTFGVGEVMYIYFYLNNTIVLKIEKNYNYYLWNDDVGYDQIGSTAILSERIYFVFTHNNTNQFNIKIYNSTFVLKNEEDLAGYSSNNWTTFDSIYISSAGGDDCSFYIDNFYIDTSIFYTPPSGETGQGCQDYNNYYSVGTGFYYYNELGANHNQIEFQSKYSINGTLNGVEILVPVDYTSILANLHLYINGEYMGYADCSYSYGNGYILQFNAINKIYNGQTLIFNLYRSDDYVKICGQYHLNSPPVAWQLVYQGDETYINNKLDGEPPFSLVIPQYLLYYSTNETSITDCGYSNSLNIMNIPVNSDNSYTVPIYKTIFFSATVNNTALPYKKITIYKENVTYYSQYYPKDVTKCSGIFGFTPTETGYYVACLTSSAVNITNTKVYFNATVTTKDYNIFTFPNPSYSGETVTIYTYINDTGSFYVGIFGNSESAINYNYSIYSTPVVYGVYEFDVNFGTLLNYPIYYLRIFKLVGSVYSAVGEIYNHYISNSEQKSFIQLNPNNLIVDNNVTIYGRNYEILKRVAIFSDTELIFDYVNNDFFSYTKQYNTVGSYIISLKAYVNNQWILLDSKQLIVSYSAGGDFPLPNIGGTVYGYIFGFVVILLFSMIPLGFAIGTDTAMRDIPIYIYLIFTCIGLCLTVVLGWIPIWIPFFIVVVLIILLLIKYLQDKDITNNS